MKTTLKMTALTVAMLGATAASAVDFGGYMRSGPGFTTNGQGNARGCYALAQAADGAKYRLGNECDTYGEFDISQTGKVDKVEYKAHLGTAIWRGQGDIGDTKLGISRMFVEAKGFDVSPETLFWAGNRYVNRQDVHIVDFFYANMSGTGAGLDTPVGPGRLGVSVYKNDNMGVATPTTPKPANSDKPASRFNVDFYGIPVNEGGTLRVYGTLTSSDYSGGASGQGLTVMHAQKIAKIGGDNTVWLQTSKGSTDLRGNFGDSSNSAYKAWRAIDSVTWQSGPLGGQAQVAYTKENNLNLTNVTGMVSRTTGTIGGRMSYAVTNNFKMLVDGGFSQVKVNGGASQNLTKLTIAPTLTTGPGFWNRPELRFYVTTAKWNQAANDGANAASAVSSTVGGITTTTLGAGGLSGAGGNKTSGTSFGFQAEIWF